MQLSRRLADAQERFGELHQTANPKPVGIAAVVGALIAVDTSPLQPNQRAPSMPERNAKPATGGDQPFLTDIKTLRDRARQHIEEGAVTTSYGADRAAVVKVLNDALATEIVCVLRYKRHYFMAHGIHAESIKSEFLEHANEEQGHADILAKRIVQLGGEPDLNPAGFASRSHSQYVEGTSLVDIIKEDLVAERIAIDSYREIVRWLEGKDSTTRRTMEEILAKEEEHADDLNSLLRNVGEGGGSA